MTTLWQESKPAAHQYTLVNGISIVMLRWHGNSALNPPGHTRCTAAGPICAASMGSQFCSDSCGHPRLRFTVGTSQREAVLKMASTHA